jgi:hypothetical protein
MAAMTPEIVRFHRFTSSSACGFSLKIEDHKTRHSNEGTLEANSSPPPRESSTSWVKEWRATDTSYRAGLVMFERKHCVPDEVRQNGILNISAEAERR